MVDLRRSVIQLSLVLLSVSAGWFFAAQLYDWFDINRNNDQNLQRNLARSAAGKMVLIGDCTISPYYFMTEEDENLKVLGFGGSEIEEWYYLVRKHRDDLKQARTIVIGTSHPQRFFFWHARYINHHTWFMSWQDLYDFVFVQQQVEIEEAARFALAKALPSFRSGQDNRQQFLQAILPNQQHWYNVSEQFFVLQEKGGTVKDGHVVLQPYINRRFASLQKDPTAKHAVRDEWTYLKKLRELSQEMEGRFVFMLTPRSSRMRTEKFLQ